MFIFDQSVGGVRSYDWTLDGRLYSHHPRFQALIRLVGWLVSLVVIIFYWSVRGVRSYDRTLGGRLRILPPPVL